MKILFLFLLCIFCIGTHSTPSSKKNTKDKVYSFQPLLIQGKRQFVKKAKDMKVEGESIVNSELFFIKRDLLNRKIFEEADLE